VIITEWISHAVSSLQRSQLITFRIRRSHSGGYEDSTFWGITPCGQIQVNRYFVETCSVHLRLVYFYRTTRRYLPHDRTRQIACNSQFSRACYASFSSHSLQSSSIILVRGGEYIMKLAFVISFSPLLLTPYQVPLFSSVPCSQTLTFLSQVWEGVNNCTK
jgi:hypothetical protein